LIDKALRRFLDLPCFGVRDVRGPLGRRWLLPYLLLALGWVGCTPRKGPGAVEDSLTSGRITIVCAPEARDLLAREREAFQALYPQARITLESGSSRDGVGALFAARCDAAVITRELSPEERAAAVRGRLELEGYRFARDALVMVVNPANPVQNVSVEELRGMYSGEVRDWSRLGGPGHAVRPVVQPMESDVTAFFIDRIMGGRPIGAPAIAAVSDSEVVARVAQDRDAIGYVTLAWARRGAKALRVSALTGLPALEPDAESVYRGTYPITRFFNYYLRTGGAPLAGGFSTFLTSHNGQKLVQESGLVPTSVPVRFVRRSPMLQSH
jgi:phosphate transport system substrate-binding protein